jgi:hypothetical protein
MGLGPGIRVSAPKRNASQCLDEAFGFLSRLLSRFAGRSIAGEGLTSSFLRGWARISERAFWEMSVHHSHITILLFPFIPLRRSDVTLTYNASAIVS